MSWSAEPPIPPTPRTESQLRHFDPGTKQDPVDTIVDWPMYDDPFLVDVGTFNFFDPRLKDIWLAAMQRRSAEGRGFDDDQIRSADAISRAYGLGMKGLESTVPVMTTMLQSPGTSKSVRLSLIRTLIRMNASQASDAIFNTQKDQDLDLILASDPGLAAWKNAQATAVWRQRLADRSLPSVIRRSAVVSLGTVGDVASFSALLAIASDSNADASMRISAARAVSACRGQNDLQSVSARLAVSLQVTDRLVAALMLASSSGAPTVGTLLTLAADSEPAVAGLALLRILEIDPKALKDIGPGLLANADPNVRQRAAMCLFELKTPEAMTILGPALNDENVDVRVSIRDRFIQLDSEPSLSAPIRSVCITQLNSDNWRSQEEAAYVLGKVKEATAEDRLVVLLDSDHYEVALAAAVGIRWLGVAKDGPTVLAHVQSLIAEMLKKINEHNAPGAASASKDQKTSDKTSSQGQHGRNHQSKNWIHAHELIISQLIQDLGLIHCTEADGYLRSLIPKGSLAFADLRASAIWSLGIIHAGHPDPSLADELAGRLNDNGMLDGEAASVRRFSAITIGRLKGGQYAALQHWYDESKGRDSLAVACRWAMMQISGKNIPMADPVAAPQNDWFLQPLIQPPASP